jgi:hypothetical protein
MQPQEVDRHQPPQFTRSPFRQLTSIALCMALILSSWPVMALAATREFKRDPERFLLRHADALDLPDVVRVQLARRTHQLDTSRSHRPHLIAPDFDRRLAAMESLLVERIAGGERGGAPTRDVRSSQDVEELRRGFLQDRAAIEAEWDRLAAQLDRRSTSSVLSRLLAQRAEFENDFAHLDAILDDLQRPRSRKPHAELGAGSGMAAHLTWLRERIPRSRLPDFDDRPLPFTRRHVDGPIQPATTPEELEARLRAGDDSAIEAPSGREGGAPRLADDPPGPADLAETPEVQFTPAIQALATSLENNPVQIFNWVRNNVEFAPVSGSIQGADHCLQTLVCTDADIASLLIALLRVSGIHARYQVGTVDIPEEQAKNWVRGADTLQVAGDVMATGSIPGVIFNGDRLRLERVWVRAYVDMIPSRGAVHTVGDTWVDLDAAFKQYDILEQPDISGSVPTDPTILDDVLNSGTTGTDSITSMNMGMLETAIDGEATATAQFFEAMDPDLPASTISGADFIVPEERAMLAGTVPFQVVTTSTPVTQVPAALRHTLAFRLLDEFGSQVFSFSQSLAELSGKRIALVYEPASAADESAVAALFEGVQVLADVPTTIPSSIQARAHLKIEGVTVASGYGVPYGTTEELFLDFNGPLGPRSIPGNVTAGSYIALGLDLGRISPALIEGLEAEAEAILAADSDPDLQTGLSADTTIGTLLQSGILGWFRDLDIRHRRLAKGSGVISQRLPSSGFYFSAMAVETLFGVPVSATLAGATLDIMNDFGFVLAKNGDHDLSVHVAYAQGQTGSEMEASSQEVRLSTEANPVNATSTLRILRQANDEGIPIYRIDNTNSSIVLPLLQHSASDMSLVTSALASGREVIIPETPVIFAGEPIVGLITQDPSTGSAAYLISGSLGVRNGGLAEFSESVAFAVMIAIFFAIVSILALGLPALAVTISTGVALFAGIAGILISVIGFFMTWSDVVEGQADRGKTIGEALAGFGILLLFSIGLGLSLYALFNPVTLGFILGALAFGIFSIFAVNWLKGIIIGFFQQLIDGVEDLYLVRMDERQTERASGDGLCPA